MSKSTARLTVAEAAARLGVSTSTVWRLIRRGDLRSVRLRGRRLIPEDAIARRAKKREIDEIDKLPPFTGDNPMFRLMGAGRSGGRGPGSEDKYGILDR